MKVLLKNVSIVDPASPYHHSRKDILITNGLIRKLETGLTDPVDQVINLPDLHASPGWLDIFADFCDPGYEFRETLLTGVQAAAAGGFTGVFVVPNTRPAIDAKTQVEYVVRQALEAGVRIIPIGAITRNTEGKELAEMYDMNNSGALAFSDGWNPVQSAGILVKALQYVKAFQGVIIQIPDDKSIAPQGLINEGVVSTRLGLPGKPMMAEELFVARDIKLARYTDSRLHFTGITSPRSLDYIKRAKDGGLMVTCSVTPYHLAFCDEDLLQYDTNLKVNPPLRSRRDMMILRQAVAEGVIDCVASHHLPQSWDHKTCEFEYARFGMSAIQTVYPLLRTLLPEISQERWLELLGSNARKIFGLPQPVIRENEPAELSLFQPEGKFRMEKGQIKSKSYNTPFIGKEFTGKVAGIFNQGRLILNP